MIDPKLAKQAKVFELDRQLGCCRYLPGSAAVLAGGFDGRLHRFDLASGKHDAIDAHRGWVETMAPHPDGKHFYSADSWGQVHCWKIEADRLTRHWTIDKAHATWLRRLTVSGDGKWLATCGNDCLVRLFDAASGKPVRDFTGHEHHVHSSAFHPDGKTLASGDLRGQVKHWDLATGKCLRTLDAGSLYKKYHQYDQGGVRVMTFAPGGAILYCAGFQGTNANQAHGVPTIVPLDWKSGKALPAMTPRADFKGPIVDIAFHPAGFLIAAGSSEAGGVLWFFRPGAKNDEHLVKYANSFRGLDLSGDGLQLVAAAFGDRGGQRGGNGRRLDKDGNYPGFGGSLVLFALDDKKKP